MEQRKHIDLEALTLARGERAKTGMCFHHLRYHGQPLSIVLGPVGELPATMPIEASMYNGDGSEARKTARFDVGDDLLEAMARFQERVLGMCSASSWKDARKCATESYSGFLRAKIWTQGDRECVVHDANGNMITLPEQPWPKPLANAVIPVKGVYQQTRTAGLQLEVTHLQLKPARGARRA